jgi:hypothetical protein
MVVVGDSVNVLNVHLMIKPASHMVKITCYMFKKVNARTILVRVILYSPFGEYQ